MQRIIKASFAALLLTVAWSATAGNVPSPLERIERHYLCRTYACFDPLASYDNAAAYSGQISTDSWVAPSGLRCNSGQQYNNTCVTFTTSKDVLKGALKMTVDEEFVYLIGNRMKMGPAAWSSYTPFVIKEVSVTDTSVTLYGGDRRFESWGLSRNDGVSIFP